MEKRKKALVHKEKLSILVTNEDKFGDNILAMSNFFNGYIDQLGESAREHSEALMELPVADLSIIGEVINGTKTIMRGNVELVPDIKNLPKDIRKKLKEGTYKLGESRQVEGNLRAVIVDENGQRVRDITLRKIQKDPISIDTIRNLETQLQLQQIYAKLNDIGELNYFLIKRQHAETITDPFLLARTYILEAQHDDCSETDRVEYLKKADELLLSSETSTYSEMKDAISRLSQLTRVPMVTGFSSKKYMNMFAEDLQLVTRTTGLRLHLLNYLGKKSDAEIELYKYKSEMTDLFVNKLKDKDMTAVELIHTYYPYNKENRDCFLNLGNDMKARLAAIDFEENKDYYLVSVEDDKNER